MEDITPSVRHRYPYTVDFTLQMWMGRSFVGRVQPWPLLHRRSASARFSITQSPTISPGVLDWLPLVPFSTTKALGQCVVGSMSHEQNRASSSGCLLSPRLEDMGSAQSRITSPALRNDDGCVRRQASGPYLAMDSCRWEGTIGGKVLQGACVF